MLTCRAGCESNQRSQSVSGRKVSELCPLQNLSNVIEKAITDCSAPERFLPIVDYAFSFIWIIQNPLQPLTEVTEVPSDGNISFASHEDVRIALEVRHVRLDEDATASNRLVVAKAHFAPTKRAEDGSRFHQILEIGKL